MSTPTIMFDRKDEENCFYTLVMSNPDSHFTEENSEYLHWMVGNIPSTSCSMESQDNIEDFTTDLASMGETVCPYLQPFPSYGTGFHRFVFILYKHVSSKKICSLIEYRFIQIFIPFLGKTQLFNYFYRLYSKVSLILLNIDSLPWTRE